MDPGQIALMANKAAIEAKNRIEPAQSQKYILPAKCKAGLHTFDYSRIHVTFLNESITQPYYPDIFYHELCVRCLQRK